MTIIHIEKILYLISVCIDGPGSDGYVHLWLHVHIQVTLGNLQKKCIASLAENRFLCNVLLVFSVAGSRVGQLLSSYAVSKQRALVLVQYILSN